MDLVAALFVAFGARGFLAARTRFLAGLREVFLAAGFFDALAFRVGFWTGRLVARLAVARVFFFIVVVPCSVARERAGGGW